MKKIYKINPFYKNLPFFAKLFQNLMLSNIAKNFTEKKFLINLNKHCNSYEFMGYYNLTRFLGD